MENTYNIGDIIKVKVSGIEKYGIFVHVDDLYNGLIHISEISSGFIP
ncbi:MAG: S1 RNA-binding domain-containing protein, partial [Bacilli bacterium]